MKLGNISQTIVPVPKFYTDKNTRTVELLNLLKHLEIKPCSKEAILISVQKIY
jgi:hypothetical protein